MIDIVEMIIAFAFASLSQIIGVSILLYRADIDKKRIVKYFIYGVIILGILMICRIPIFTWYMIGAIYIVCFFYEGTVMEKVSVNLFSLAILDVCDLIYTIILNDAIRQGKFLWLENQIVIEILVCLMMLLIKVIVRKTGLFDKKREGVSWLTFNHSISLSILSLASTVLSYTGKLISDEGIEVIVNTNRMANTLIFIAVVFILAATIGINDDIGKQYYKWINQLIENQVKRQLKFYERLESINKETRAIKHDMKNHMIVVRRLAEKGELQGLQQYLTHIEYTAEKLDNILHTGNSIVDAIINEKLEVAHKKHIPLEAKIQLPKELSIEPIDICVIMANSIDNAIEACGKIEEEDMRQIQVRSSCDKGYFIYSISNTTKEPVKIVNKQMATSKKDSLNHGYGIINMRTSVEKYDGELSMDYKENCFYLYIEIPIKDSSILD